MLHDLSDALPAKQYLSVPREWWKRRMRVPRGVILRYADIPRKEVTWLGPVPITKPLRTIADCVADHVVDDFVRQAVEQGVRRRLFDRAEVNAAMRRARQKRDPAAELSATSAARASRVRAQEEKCTQSL